MRKTNCIVSGDNLKEMYSPFSFTIACDGKTVTAINNKTGKQATGLILSDENFILTHKAISAIETLIENQADNKDEIKVGDRVQFIDNFDSSYVYPYATDFVDELDIPNVLKIKYCYSVSRPPLNSIYYVKAIENNRAYIQIASCGGRCYVVSTRILKKVTK